MEDYIRKLSAGNYWFSQLRSVRTKLNFEKRITVVHSSQSDDLNKFFLLRTDAHNMISSLTVKQEEEEFLLATKRLEAISAVSRLN